MLLEPDKGNVKQLDTTTRRTERKKSCRRDKRSLIESTAQEAEDAAKKNQLSQNTTFDHKET